MTNEARDFAAGLKRRLVDKAGELLHGDAHAPAVAGEPAWKSALAWEAKAKPECLVVMCGDSRFLPHTQRFLEEGLGLKDYQVFAVPGGVQWLALPDILPKHNKVARWAIGFVIEAKDIRRVVCIAHQDCGAYQDGTTLSSLAHLATGKTVAEHQLDQLKKAGREIAAEFNVAVELYYASVAPRESSGRADGSVVFHRVEAGS